MLKNKSARLLPIKMPGWPINPAVPVGTITCTPPNSKQELEKGGRADPAAVQKIVAQYQAREPGLRSPRFVATRKALEAWLDELQQPKLSDLPGLARAAKQNYQPIAKADVLARQTAAESAVRRLDSYLNRPGNHGARMAFALGLERTAGPIRQRPRSRSRRFAEA